MQYTLVNTVLLFFASIPYAFYCTVDEFFTWMLDLSKDSVMCTFVSDLFQHWLEHLFDD
jgi:hypothetical protein